MTLSIKSHAVLDLASRQLKAKKIERLLNLNNLTGKIKLLEIGVGSGGICHYFSTHSSGRYEVHGVDITDQRLVFDGYTFYLVKDTKLPFQDNEFDVVISNHVIEHVGNDEAQDQHLRELHRVLKASGIGYLAVPNRWMLIEPHYQLAFLSWWPERCRTSWLHFWRKGKNYDCRPHSLRTMRKKLRNAQLVFEHLHIEAITATFEIENKDSVMFKIIKRIPLSLLKLLAPVNPTLIFCFRRSIEKK